MRGPAFLSNPLVNRSLAARFRSPHFEHRVPMSSDDPTSTSHTPLERLTAFHEAGHAVVALLMGRAVQRVSIEPDTTRLGKCEFGKGTFRKPKDLLEADVLVLLAGVAAEARVSGEYAWGGASQDLKSARRLTRSRAGSERQAERLERRLLDKVEHLLADAAHWSAVEVIAAELLAHRTISGRAAKHHFDRAVES